MAVAPSQMLNRRLVVPGNDPRVLSPTPLIRGRFSLEAGATRQILVKKGAVGSGGVGGKCSRTCILFLCSRQLWLREAG